jgi:hypothetical protein
MSHGSVSVERGERAAIEQPHPTTAKRGAANVVFTLGEGRAR